MPINSIDRRRNITKTVGKKIFRLIEKRRVGQLHMLPAAGKKWNCSKLVQIKYKQYKPNLYVYRKVTSYINCLTIFTEYTKTVRIFIIASYINFKWLEILFYNLNFYFSGHSTKITAFNRKY